MPRRSDSTPTSSPMRTRSALLKYDAQQASGLRGAQHFYAWIDNTGRVDASTAHHHDMIGVDNMTPEGAGEIDRMIREGHVRATVSHDYRSDPDIGARLISVHFHRDSPEAHRHAIEFVRNQHRRGLPIYMDRDANDPADSDDAVFQRPDEMAAYLEKHPPKRKVTAVARAREFPFGGEESVGSHIRQHQARIAEEASKPPRRIQTFDDAEHEQPVIINAYHATSNYNAERIRREGFRVGQEVEANGFLPHMEQRLGRKHLLGDGVYFADEERKNHYGKAGYGTLHKVEVTLNKPYVLPHRTTWDTLKRVNPDELKAQGYDGIIVKSGQYGLRGGENYRQGVVFHPHQIRIVDKHEPIRELAPYATVRHKETGEKGLVHAVREVPAAHREWAAANRPDVEQPPSHWVTVRWKGSKKLGTKPRTDHNVRGHHVEVIESASASMADALITAVLHEIAKPAKVKFSDMHAAPEIPDAIRQHDYFHGVDNDEAAHKILAAGRLEPATYGHGTRFRGYDAPRRDKVYLTKRHQHAARIALSGVSLGDDSEEPYLKSGRYGYVFKVAGQDLNNVEADEDNVERAYWNTRSGGERNFPGLGVSHAVADLGSRVLSKKDHDTLMGGGSFKQRVRVAKKLAGQMTPEMHHDLVLTQNANIAHGGPVRIVGAWRIDKTRNDEFHWDGSDLFQKAEPLHHLIGKGLK